MPTYYKRNVNPTNNNWNQADNWSTVSSTSSTNTGTFPSSLTADPVIFDANSVAVTVNVASQCTSLDFTGYNNTITFNNQLIVQGNVTLSAAVNFTIAGTGQLRIQGTSTITSNGKVYNGNIHFANPTVTLSGDLTITGAITVSGNSIIVNGGTINIQGNLISAGQHNFGTTGNGTFIFNGTGNQSISGIFLSLQNGSIIFNKPSGTLTIAGSVTLAAANITYITGTIVYSGGAFTMSKGGGTCTITSNGHNWGGNGANNVTFALGATVTLTTFVLADDFTVGTAVTSFGLFNSGGNAHTLNGPGVLYMGSTTALVPNASSANYTIGGTADIRFQGTGTCNYTVSGMNISNNIILNGNVTFSGTMTKSGGTITYTSGAITTTLFTLTTVTCTLNTNGVTWSNIVCRPETFGSTLTLNSNLQAINISLSYVGGGSVQYTFAGIGGFTTSAFTTTQNSITIRFTNGNTYIVTNNLGSIGTAANLNVFTAVTVGLPRAIFTLQQGASQNMVYTNGTFIDSGAGQTIWTFGGNVTLNNTINWNNLLPPRGTATPFIS